MKFFLNYFLIGLIGLSLVITSCGEDDEVPPEEDELEVITDVTLIFTNNADPADVVRASAKDSDGAGITEELEVLDEITLSGDATYTLTLEIMNAVDPTDVEDIVEEIEEEDDEHQFFFGFTSDAFSDPTGDGNIDALAANAVNYEDEDSDAQDGSGNPVGLETTWTTGTAISDGTFRIILMHQPPLADGTPVKTATSDINVGDTDIDLTFVLNIE